MWRFSKKPDSRRISSNLREYQSYLKNCNVSRHQTWFGRVRLCFCLCVIPKDITVCQLYCIFCCGKLYSWEIFSISSTYCQNFDRVQSRRIWNTPSAIEFHKYFLKMRRLKTYSMLVKAPWSMERKFKNLNELKIETEV